MGKAIDQRSEALDISHIFTFNIDVGRLTVGVEKDAESRSHARLQKPQVVRAVAGDNSHCRTGVACLAHHGVTPSLSYRSHPQGPLFKII